MEVISCRAVRVPVQYGNREKNRREGMFFLFVFFLKEKKIVIGMKIVLSPTKKMNWGGKKAYPSVRKESYVTNAARITDFQRKFRSLDCFALSLSLALTLALCLIHTLSFFRNLFRNNTQRNALTFPSLVSMSACLKRTSMRSVVENTLLVGRHSDWRYR